MELSASTLLALKEFALDQGYIQNENEEEGHLNLRQTVQDAITAVQSSREEEFVYTYGDDIKLILSGVRRDLGQTLSSTGFTLWRAADTLADYIYLHKDDFHSKSVLELGAGLGLCGLLMANFCSTIIMTDGCPETIELLQQNVKRNHQKGDLECRLLQWTIEVEGQDPLLGETFDLVMGSDIVYEEDCVKSLFQTSVRYMKKNKSSRFILAYTKRNVSIVYVLEEAEKAGLEVESGPEENNEGIYHFRLRFFTQEF